LDSAIEALQMGAFNYLLKPVSPDLIRSQVRAGLQMWRKQQRQQQLCRQFETLRQTLLELEDEDEVVSENGRFLHTEKLHIDRQRQTAVLDGRSLDLTTTEYNLLLCLVQNTPEPVSPQALLHCALGYEAPLQEARELIKWHIHQLRRKVETDPAHPRYIKTVRYKGYLWSG
jgi:DNA-binding response OmpR family regulator